MSRVRIAFLTVVVALLVHGTALADIVPPENEKTSSLMKIGLASLAVVAVVSLVAIRRRSTSRSA